MSKMNGWVRLYRKSLDHWLYNESRPHTRREAWEDMLLLANHSDEKVMIEGELIECKRGQSVMSLKSWAKQFKWSIQQIRTFFKLLQNDNMIVTEGMRKTTRVTICNYEIYQSEQQADNKQTTRRKHGDNKQITTNKNDKNEKKVYARKEKILNYKPITEEEIKTQEWLNKQYPRIQSLELPLIASELLSKVKEYGKDLVVKKLSAMENKKNLLKDYIDAGRTLENWLSDIEK
jgi:hypothetical protein